MDNFFEMVFPFKSLSKIFKYQKRRAVVFNQIQNPLDKIWFGKKNDNPCVVVSSDAILLLIKSFNKLTHRTVI